MVYYRIERIANLTFGELANDSLKRQQLTEALKVWGDAQWTTFQISEADGGLLVFMSHATP